MPRWLNLANLFTLLRLALVPFVIEAIVDGRHGAALVLFIVAGLTDVADGAAARRLGLVTRSGAYLDPIADKCLLSGVFLALAAARLVPWWFVAVVLGRDLYILVGVAIFLLASPVRKFPPSVWGKLSTFIQIGTAVVYMTRNLHVIPGLDVLASATLWLCAGSTLWSGIHYTWRALKTARAH